MNKLNSGLNIAIRKINIQVFIFISNYYFYVTTSCLTKKNMQCINCNVDYIFAVLKNLTAT